MRCSLPGKTIPLSGARSRSPQSGRTRENPNILFSFSKISPRRKRAEEELSLLNTGLECRIAERTRELEWVNSALLAENRQRSLAEEKLKRSLHEKEILIKEIHHRVKNNLQIIISLLFLQAKKTEDPLSEAALTDSQTRVKSMALVHEKLYQSDSLSSIDFHGYLQNLVSNLMITYGIDQTRIRITHLCQESPPHDQYCNSAWTYHERAGLQLPQVCLSRSASPGTSVSVVTCMRIP